MGLYDLPTFKNVKATPRDVEYLVLEALRSIGETTVASVHDSIRHGWINDRHEFGQVTKAQVRGALNRLWAANVVYQVLVPVNPGCKVYGNGETQFYGIATPETGC